MESVGVLEAALEAAFAQYDVEGERRLRVRFDMAHSRHVTVRDGRRYDADILGSLILAQASSRLARLVTDSPAALVEASGEKVRSLAAWSREDELAWRMSVWDAVRENDADARWLRERGVYGGMQGIWVDAERTRALRDLGVAVAVRHTGRHYADDIDDRMAIYYYPRTARPASRDMNEVEAVKNAAELHLPIFFIGEGPRGLRPVRLAWVIAADDRAEVFLLEFAEAEPRHLDVDESRHPFELTVNRRRSRSTTERLVRAPEFKYRVLARHGGRCAVTGLGIPVVLDAAHVVPVADGGSDDERNGLLLTANLHRAFDAHLWAIEPSTLLLHVRRQGPSLSELQVDALSLRSDVRPPHRDALEWRWRKFAHSTRSTDLGDTLADARVSGRIQ
ncbi:HNH endonuclease [Cellulomonas carbonis]|uniref:HNH nuclease domain-containing protein n=1 Tax=Cellulomonas carbonis T26 TaxID=947969 RepID=A0A0A0BTD4_9CELL|nr:HNH endonuclease signature motif containing protein [Cellulomonas carbonis]KGM10952.1 hypothetical protein N868_12880 [Cellulomonas carbonis T26]GGC02349.1 hypothetical protein GCM10010972_14110 [Cellulomonas carbonis]